MRAITAGCALGITYQAMGISHVEEDDHFNGVDSYRAHLYALVVHLEEKAQLEGKPLLVKWRHDGSVMVRCADFIQRMWCQAGELHIDYNEPAANWPEN